MVARWKPDLAGRKGPRYVAIAECMAADIASGRLPPGRRLPTHRELASRLGVTIATVTRAYAEVERRGLVSGEVGRGTYVRGRVPDRVAIAARPTPGFVDLSRNLPPVRGPVRRIFRRHLEAVARADAGPLLAYGPYCGLAAHREAGAAWLARRGLAVDPASVVVTAGARNAIALALTALAQPGDTVLCETLTIYGIQSMAAQLGIRLAGVAIDRDGLVPEALDAACRRHAAKALIVVPTFHSPTTALMPQARRRKIAAICRARGVVAIEDDIYGFLDESSVPLAAYAPESTVLVTSLSKAVAGGLRAGYMLAPHHLLGRLAEAIRYTIHALPPIAAELAARLVISGDAARIANWQRRHARRRRGLALAALSGHAARCEDGAAQIWLGLPDGWTADGFAEAARRSGVGVTPADSFAVPRTEVPRAVRLSLATPERTGDLAAALAVLRDLLGRPNRR